MNCRDIRRGIRSILFFCLATSALLSCGNEEQAAVSLSNSNLSKAEDPAPVAVSSSQPQYHDRELIVEFEPGLAVYNSFAQKLYLESNQQALSHLRETISPLQRVELAEVRPVLSKLAPSRIQGEIRSGKMPDQIFRNQAASIRSKRLLSDKPAMTKSDADRQASAMASQLSTRAANSYVLKFSSAISNREELIAEIKQQAGIKDCRPVLQLSIVSDLPSDTYVDPNQDGQWSQGAWGQTFLDLWGMEKIEADQAWNIDLKGQGVIVAVIDTGVDRNHPDISANMWTNPGELPGNGIDDDQNGFVDDVYGMDFAQGDTDPTDGHGHGTHCAGTIAAPINSIGVVGVAPQAKIMAVKGLSDGGSGADYALADGVYYAVDNGAHVLSNSWGGGGTSPDLIDAFHYAHEQGVVVIAAAGNENSDVANFFPANIDTVVAVAATNYLDQKASFSNWGEQIDISAPGAAILSLKANGTQMTSVVVGSDYLPASGTSMACPHVAGAAALILTGNVALTPDEVLNLLKFTADDLGNPGFDVYFGHGRINVSRFTPPGRGILFLDQNIYGIQETSAQISLVDFNYPINPNLRETVQVFATSSSRPLPLPITLTEVSLQSTRFEGVLPFTTLPNGAGLLIADEDTVSLKYFDANAGEGQSAVVEISASIDGSIPLISNVRAGQYSSGAMITWSTNEPSSSRVFYGTSINQMNSITRDELTTSHNILLSGLESDRIYFFYVQSTDHVGNIGIDNNQGAYYQFLTQDVTLWVAPGGGGGGTFLSLQEAVDAAGPFNTIQVVQGVYTSANGPIIRWVDKPLFIRGGYAYLNGPRDPVLYPTILDGEYRGISCVSIQNVPAPSEFSGFIVKRGLGTYLPSTNSVSFGGGLFGIDSSLLIRNCHFEDNQAGYGGGLSLFFENIPGQVRIEHCKFLKNQSNANGYYVGGGAISVQTKLFVSLENSIEIDQCEFVENGATSYGGAILLQSTSLYSISNCRFESNVAAYGGAVAIAHCGLGPLGLPDPVHAVRLKNCVFLANRVGGSFSPQTCNSCAGGAIYLYYSGSVIDHCSFLSNSSERGRAIATDFGSIVKVANSILWDGGDEVRAEEFSGLAYIEVAYSNVQGITWGVGNINVDPGFLNASDAHLSLNSPCRDAGDPGFTPGVNEKDIDGELRILGSRTDMGADEWSSVLLGNQAPSVTLGSDQSIHFPQSVTLSGVVQDDGLPSGNAVVLHWSLMNSSGSVVFSDVFSSTSSVSFPEPGTYSLRLTASDGQKTGFDQVDVRVLPAIPNPTPVLWVDSNATGSSGDGSVEAPFSNLRLALANAAYGSEIRVVGGNYVVEPPTGQTNHYYSLHWEGIDLIIRGGWSAVGSSLRDPKLYPSILIFSDQVYTKSGVGAVNLSSLSELSGFTFRKSYSFFGALEIRESDLLVLDCVFEDNHGFYGGGITVNHGNPRIERCQFINNYSANPGGGICNYFGAGLIKDSVFISNQGDHGGGIFNIYGSSTHELEVQNCAFISNVAVYKGCGIYSIRSHLKVNECSFLGSFAGSSIFSKTGRLDIANSILWTGSTEGCFNTGEILTEDSPATVRYCNIRGGAPGEGNIELNPNFLSDSDWHLSDFSPCINAGDPSISAGINETDLEGEPRVRFSRIDIGADETDIAFVPNNRPTVCAGQDQSMVNQRTAQLNGIAVDDGRPVGSELSAAWSIVIAPAFAEVTFSSPYSPQTSVTVSRAGDYLFRLTANDGVFSSSDEVQIAFELDCSNNPAPVAEAGPNQGAIPNALMFFDGFLSTDNIGISSYRWNFGDGAIANSVTANHSYSSPGVYTVSLIVFDGCNRASEPDTLTVTIATPSSCPASVAPIANGGADQVGHVGFPLTFHGSGIAGPHAAISSYRWDFGDGTATEWNSFWGVSSHSYGSSGSYLVRLWVKDNCETISQFDSVQVTVLGGNNHCNGNVPPIANAGQNQSGQIGQSLAFSAIASSDPGGSILSYVWNFGDGQIASGVNVSHSYSAAGSYTVVLTVTDNCNASTTHSVAVTIHSTNQAPSVNAGADQTITFPVSAILQGNANDDGLPNPPGVLSYQWSKVSGVGTVVFANPSSAQTTASFSAAGIYQLRLTVNDGQLSASDDVNITVNPSSPCGNNQTPTANAGPDRSGSIAQSLSFSGSSSTDPNGNATITSYWWNFGDGQYTGWQANATVSHSFATAGTYNVRLWVRDNCGAMSASDSAVATISSGSNPCNGNTAPVANAGPNKSGQVNQALSFSGAGSSDPGGSISSYSWNFGDGQMASGINVSHSYSNAGNYTVTLTVIDNCNASASDTASVSIQAAPQNQPPTVNAGADQTVTLPALANLDATATDDGLPNPPGQLSIAWSKQSGPGNVTFGNSAAIDTSASFSMAGSYILRITVSDGGAPAVNDSVAITVNPEPPTEPGIFWVDDNAANNPTQNGSSANPFGSIQQAINAAAPDNEIRVVAGTYTKINGHILDWQNKDLKIRGGYAAVGSTVRNPAQHLSIIDGNNVANRSCVLARNLNEDAELSGFIIKRGNYSQGGGMHNDASHLLIANCLFTENQSPSFGGAIYMKSFAEPVIRNCKFQSNSAVEGGAIYSSDSYPNLRNCAFISNTASSMGGAMRSKYSNLTIASCSFIANAGGSNNAGHALAHLNGNSTINNSLFWDGASGAEIYKQSGTLTVSYSDVRGGYAGTGNLNVNPQLLANNDFHIGANSPCKNAGDPMYQPESSELDLDNEIRVKEGRVDIGCDEK